MSRDITIQPLTAEAFRPFGDVIEAAGQPDKLINQGHCGRYHDRAALRFEDGRAGLSKIWKSTGLTRLGPCAHPFDAAPV